MNEGEDLLSRLAGVEAQTLVPGRRLDPSPPAPVAVCDALVLREDLVLAMFAEGNGYVVAPLVVRAAGPPRPPRGAPAGAWAPAAGAVAGF